MTLSLPHSAQELDDIEKSAQPYLDNFYEWNGCTVDRTQAGYFHDAVITTTGGRTIRVEEKIRRGEFSDIAVELMDGIGSNETTKGLCRHDGWILYADCDVIAYTMCLPNGAPAQLHRLKMPDFRQWFFGWLRDTRHGEWISSTKGTRGVAMNVLVPIGDIPRTIITTYTRTLQGQWRKAA